MTSLPTYRPASNPKKSSALLYGGLAAVAVVGVAAYAMTRSSPAPASSAPPMTPVSSSSSAPSKTIVSPPLTPITGPPPMAYRLALMVNGSTGPISLYAPTPPPPMAVGGYIVSVPVSIAGADPGVTVNVSVASATNALGFMPQTPSAAIVPGSGGTGSGSIGFAGAGLYTIVATQSGSTTSNSVSVNVINAKSTAAPSQGTSPPPIVSPPSKLIVSPPASSGILSSLPGTGGLIPSPPTPVVSPPTPVVSPPAGGLLSSLPGTGGLFSSPPAKTQPVVSPPARILPPARDVLPPAMAVVPSAHVPYAAKGWTGTAGPPARLPYSVKGRALFGTQTYNLSPTGVPFGIDVIPQNGQPILVASPTFGPGGRPYGMNNDGGQDADFDSKRKGRTIF